MYETYKYITDSTKHKCMKKESIAMRTNHRYGSLRKRRMR